MRIDLSSLSPVFTVLYGSDQDAHHYQLTRYRNLVAQYRDLFESEPVEFYSSPGRTEISGNHTDHNLGLVLAASVNLDSIAAVEKYSGEVIRVYSDGFDEPFEVTISDLTSKPEEEGTTSGLIRGIVAHFRRAGHAIGAFNAVITSDVLIGSGLSSSASIEVLIGTVLNDLYNGGQIPAAEIARIGQLAENEFFNKPCGLMDQMACAVGGIISIDFAYVTRPVVRKVPFDISASDYCLIIVNTGGSHADLTSDYAAIPAEMKAIARALGFENGRQLTRALVYQQIPMLRKRAGDRAILRMLHFLSENERVTEQVKALTEGNIDRFLQLVNASGDSSNKLLQNIYSVQNASEQGLNLALTLADEFVRETGQGACRVHGGGFAGTIQCFIPSCRVGEFTELMDGVFGEQSVLPVKIRPVGALNIKSVL
jgi:galactokinase